MTRGRWTQGQLESLVISILIHLAIIFLVPYMEPAPTVDIFPLDFAGVIEISAVETEPAAPAPAPGLNVKDVSRVPKTEPPKAKPAKKKEQPKPTITEKPVVKDELKPVVESKPKQEPKAKPELEQAAKPEAKPTTPVIDKPEVVTSPASKSEVSAKTPDPAPPPEAALSSKQEHVSDLASKPLSEHKDSETSVTSPKADTGAVTASGTGSITGSGKEPASAGKPSGSGVVPHPEYPGNDPTGFGMIRSTGGVGHGVWIPKGVQNLKGQGEAKLRICVKSDGTVDSVSFLTAPPDRAMEKPIREAVMQTWVFEPDTTPGKEDAYYIDVWIGYNGGTEDVSFKSERASYER